MEPLAILRTDPLDLLFENRNKAYGAYPLRKYYAQRLYISLGLIFSLVTVFSIFYLTRKSETTHKMLSVDVGLFLDNIQPPIPDKPVLPSAKPFVPKPPASLEYVTPVITKEKEIPIPMAAVEDLGKNVIGMQTIPGGAGGEQRDPEVSSSGTSGIQKDSAESTPEILDHAEIMPEFPGGEQALKRFLQKNLRMPENNMEPGAEVKVVARFVVGSDGRVSGIEIIRAADEAFDREVRRVILKMPEWKPGMQHNRKVAVYFSLPVNFVNEEQ
jgi:periplasmic protein TonB